MKRRRDMSEKSPENKEAPSPAEKKPRGVDRLVRGLGKTAIKGTDNKK